MTLNTLIIAEAGVNHNGDLKKAYELIDAAVEAGADIVKFQSFKADKLASKNVKKAEYQISNMKESHDLLQYEMLKSLELSDESHKLLAKYCKEKGIEFLSTPFDEDSLDFLTDEIRVNYIKVPSGEIINLPFLLKMAQKKIPLIVSTGMSTLGEIETALSVIAFGLIGSSDMPSTQNFYKCYSSNQGQHLLKEYVTLLHCTTEYPAPFNEVNLKAIQTLSSAFGLCVGYSDHTQGISIPIAAVALGAKVIEKHFTLDKNLQGPDHKASLEPLELKNMVKAIREVEQSIGTGRKIPSESEQKNMSIARKVIVASKKISKNETLNKDNICFKRAGTGISPARYWDILGKEAIKDYALDDVICE